MDQTGEFLSLAEKQEVDTIKQERMEVRGHCKELSISNDDDDDDVNRVCCLNIQRLERHTRNMDTAQYTEFCESRQLSFGETFHLPLWSDFCSNILLRFVN